MASIDNIFAAVQYFALAIFMLALLLFWAGISGVSGDLWTGSTIGPTIKSNTQDLVDQFDAITVMAYIGLHLGILALVFILRTHPVIYIVSLFLIAILAIIGAQLSNAYEEVIADDQISTVSGDLPMTNFIMSNFPKFEIIWAFITVVIMFGMARYQGIV